mmetsp:Transcript_72199/g.215448  ORF Transcript_72199/g.215448 Transcript_72199/m.215448 type:complete len:201 (-) Transcript_72199:314-916(-)
MMRSMGTSSSTSCPSSRSSAGLFCSENMTLMKPFILASACTSSKWPWLDRRIAILRWSSMSMEAVSEGVLVELSMSLLATLLEASLRRLTVLPLLSMLGRRHFRASWRAAFCETASSTARRRPRVVRPTQMLPSEMMGKYLTCRCLRARLIDLTDVFGRRSASSGGTSHMSPATRSSDCISLGTSGSRKGMPFIMMRCSS